MCNFRFYIGANNLCRGARCGGTQIGNEITNRKIRFMTYRRNNRRFAIDYRTRNAFGVKCPKIFNRTAAPADYNNIDITGIIKANDRFDNIRCGICTLHKSRRNNHLCKRPSARRDIFYILNRSADIGGNNADFARISGKRLFNIIAANTLGKKLCFKLFICQI